MKPTDSSDEFDVDINACAATDCTGLIPALPQTEAEMEHYSQLYHYGPPVVRVTNQESQNAKPTDPLDRIDGSAK